MDSRPKRIRLANAKSKSLKKPKKSTKPKPKKQSKPQRIQPRRLAKTKNESVDTEAPNGSAIVPVMVQPSPSEIFSNELILEAIFENLSLDDLKECRLVNLLWQVEATKTILRCHTTKQHHLLAMNTAIIVKQYDTYVSGSYGEIINASKMFPCNNFGICSNHLLAENIQLVLASHGKYIRELEILSSNPGLFKTSLEALEDLLTKQATKLQVLTLNTVPPEWLVDSSTEFFKSMQLKNLQRLVIGKGCNQISRNFIQAILQGAVNLKKIGFTNSRKFLIFVGHLIEWGKIHLLEYCSFELNANSNSSVSIAQRIKLFEAIAEAKPQLSDISIFLGNGSQAYFGKMTKILSKCLESSAKSLKHMIDFYPLMRLPGIKIPPLPKLTEISCITGFDYSYVSFFEGKDPVFYSHLNFIDTFPNVENILLSDSPGRNYNEDDSLAALNGQPIVPHLSVKRFHVQCSEEWAESAISPPVYDYFSQKFPNLTHAAFPPTFNFLEASKHIWTKLVHLEDLQVGIGRNLESVENSFPGLEAAFTGFSIETCFRLYREFAEGKEIRQWELERLRVNPSILNLKKLTSLMIQFDSRGHWNEWFPLRPLLTCVTGRQAFALCPGLQVMVEVTFDHTSTHVWSEDSNPFLGVVPYVCSVDCFV